MSGVTCTTCPCQIQVKRIMYRVERRRGPPGPGPVGWGCRAKPGRYAAAASGEKTPSQEGRARLLGADFHMMSIFFFASYLRKLCFDLTRKGRCVVCNLSPPTFRPDSGMYPLWARLGRDYLLQSSNLLSNNLFNSSWGTILEIVENTWTIVRVHACLHIELDFCLWQ